MHLHFNSGLIFHHLQATINIYNIIKFHTNITIHVFCTYMLLGKCSVALAYGLVMMSTLGVCVCVFFFFFFFFGGGGGGGYGNCGEAGKQNCKIVMML